MTKLFLEFKPNTVPFDYYIKDKLSIEVSLFLLYPTQLIEQYDLVLGGIGNPMAKGKNDSLTVYINPEELKDPIQRSNVDLNWIEAIPPFNGAQFSADIKIIYEDKVTHLDNSKLVAAGVTDA